MWTYNKSYIISPREGALCQTLSPKLWLQLHMTLLWLSSLSSLFAVLSPQWGEGGNLGWWGSKSFVPCLTSFQIISGTLDLTAGFLEPMFILYVCCLLQDLLWETYSFPSKWKVGSEGNMCFTFHMSITSFYIRSKLSACWCEMFFLCLTKEK